MQACAQKLALSSGIQLKQQHWMERLLLG